MANENEITTNSMIKNLNMIINEQSSVNSMEDNNLISLYDLVIILKKKKEEYDNKKMTYDLLLSTAICDNYKFFFDSFNYEKREISFRIRLIGDINNIHGYMTFTKENNLLIPVIPNIKINNPLLKGCISSYYDFILQSKNYLKRTYVIIFSEPKLQVSITSDYISLTDNNYEIKANINSNQYECNIEELSINEDELFKSILVPIEGCPEWCMKEIQEFKEKQLGTAKVNVKKGLIHNE